MTDHRASEGPHCPCAGLLIAAERRAAEQAENHRRATDEQVGFVARQRERLRLVDAAAAEFRTALVFYADEANYDEETGAAGKWRRLPNTADDPGETVFEHDGGDVARAALLKDAGKNTLDEIERLKDQVNRLCDRVSDSATLTRDLATAEHERDRALEQRDQVAGERDELRERLKVADWMYERTARERDAARLVVKAAVRWRNGLGYYPCDDPCRHGECDLARALGVEPMGIPKHLQDPNNPTKLDAAALAAGRGEGEAGQ